MNLHELLAGWSGWGWPLLANHLWQATLVAGLAALAAALLGKAPARSRYLVWVIASAKFAVPAALIAFLASQAGIRTVSQADLSGAVIYQFLDPALDLGESAVAATDGHNELYCALSLIWLTGCSIFLGLWLQRRWQFSLGVGAAQPVSAGREAAALKRVRSWLGTERDIQLLITPKVIEPGVWGIRRPVVVLPETLADNLSDAELEAVLMHELVHVSRWDNLWSNLHMAVCCLFWFHPLVWWIDHKLLQERERACDEEVIALGGAPAVYAASLVKVLRFCLSWKIAGVSYAAGSNIKRRIEEIMAFQDIRPAIARRLLTGAVVVVMIALAVAAGLFNRGNAAAQSDKSRSGNTILPGGPVGGVPGGVPGGIPGGVPGGIPGGVPGGVPGGIPFIQGQDNVKQLLEQAPAAPIRFANLDGAPLTVADARVKVVTYTDSQATSDRHAAAPEWTAIKTIFQLTNNTNRRIKGFTWSLTWQEAGQKTMTTIGYELAKPVIEPYGSYTSDRLLSPRLAFPPADTGSFEVKVIGVLFEDGDTWGKALPPPPPPPPPSSEAAPAGTPPDAEGPPGHKLIRKAGGVLQADAIKRVPPTYPEVAKAARVSGAVSVEVVIDEEGNVEAAHAIAGHPLLKEAAIEAARQWQFKPTMLSGVPVKVVGTVTFNFTL